MVWWMAPEADASNSIEIAGRAPKIPGHAACVAVAACARSGKLIGFKV
jgi:hypothetical protein